MPFDPDMLLMLIWHVQIKQVACTGTPYLPGSIVSWGMLDRLHSCAGQYFLQAVYFLQLAYTAKLCRCAQF